MFRKRAFSHRGGFRRTKSGFRQRTFHSNNWFNSFTFTVPASTAITAPFVQDTFILSVPRVTAGSALVKDIRVARIIWSSALFVTIEVTNANAFMPFLEALYQDTLLPSGVSTHAAAAFLTVNEISATGVPQTWPERIFWKRLSAIQVGTDTAGDPVLYGGFQQTGITERNPVVLTPRAKLNEDGILVYRVEAGNPSTSPLPVSALTLGTFIFETRT